MIEFVKKHIWTILLILFLAATFVNKYGNDILAGFKSMPYQQEVEACYQEAQAAADTKVVGLRYSCALKIAATIYEEDPDLAIEICAKNGLLPADNNVQIMACRAQIEEILNEEEEEEDIGASESPNSKVDLTTSTVKPALENTFENAKYGYNFEYPGDFTLNNNDDFNNEITTSKSIALWNKNEDKFFIVDVLDPEPLLEYPDLKDTVERYKLPLKDYVDFVYEENNPDNVFEPLSYTVGGEKGYEMWALNNFCDGDSCRTVENDSALFYVKNNQDLIIKITISLGGGDPEYILDSFEIL